MVYYGIKGRFVSHQKEKDFTHIYVTEIEYSGEPIKNLGELEKILSKIVESLPEGDGLLSIYVHEIKNNKWIGKTHFIMCRGDYNLICEYFVNKTSIKKSGIINEGIAKIYDFSTTRECLPKGASYLISGVYFYSNVCQS
ncbi:MAG: hypothetical protein ACPLX8_01540 [Nanopusillaceae archaeon]